MFKEHCQQVFEEFSWCEISQTAEKTKIIRKKHKGLIPYCKDGTEIDSKPIAKCNF